MHPTVIERQDAIALATLRTLRAIGARIGVETLPDDITDLDAERLIADTHAALRLEAKAIEAARKKQPQHPGGARGRRGSRAPFSGPPSASE